MAGRSLGGCCAGGLGLQKLHRQQELVDIKLEALFHTFVYREVVEQVSLANTSSRASSFRTIIHRKIAEQASLAIVHEVNVYLAAVISELQPL